MNRYKSGKIASILGILGNLFLLIIKCIVGIITNSQAMIADSINSASDIISSILTFIGNKIASKPRDEDHHLGHGKAEYIYSMLISILIILVAITVFKDSLVSLFNPSIFNFSIWYIIVCIVTILVKLGLFLYTNKVAKKYNNLLILANSKDHRNDMIVTFFTLLSGILMYYGINFVDSIVGIGISIFILATGIKIFIDSYDVLMDKTMNEDTKKEVLAIIKKYPEVKKIQHFNATPVGYLFQVSFTIFVDGNLSTFASHDIANKLEKEISALDDIYLTIIHVNPI
ncbi:MAG TPA: cation transporter [Candidatus Onthocola stercorigallinarum]|nr:cation transporter [Candidatus Onthocola stercorigallinarum]